MTETLHHLERQARHLEKTMLAGIYADEHRPQRIRALPPPPKPQPDEQPAPAELGPAPCHQGLRATRLAQSVDDLAAHPGDFRCPTCNRLLDAPLELRIVTAAA